MPNSRLQLVASHLRTRVGACVAAFALVLAAVHAPDASPSTPALPLIELEGGTIEIAFDPDEFELPRDVLVEWIHTSARAVESFYGRFPVERARVELISRRGKGVITGRTEAWDGAQIRVQLGHLTDRTDLAYDWIMVHEMVHLAFPSVPRRHHWIEEGLATYVEPLARLEIGEVPPETVWLDLMDGLPNGLPAAGDRGLDFTPTWGRTYWGGALFCFLADLEIRRRTDNRKGLRDALRGIVEAGGSMEVRWTLAKALAAGDRATGVPVLTELYDKMHASPSPVDLDALWKQLGVERDSTGRLQLLPEAELDETRRAIAPEPPPTPSRSQRDVPRKFREQSAPTND